MSTLWISPKESARFLNMKSIKRKDYKLLDNSKVIEITLVVCFILLAGGKGMRYDLN